MKYLLQVALVVAGALAAAVLVIGAFIGSGIYNIAAGGHHTRIVLALIGQFAMPAWGGT